jgi:hypothetical protein
MGQDKWHKLDGHVAHMCNYISHGRLDTTDAPTWNYWQKIERSKR